MRHVENSPQGIEGSSTCAKSQYSWNELENQSELVIQPWELHRYQLISWLEMLQFSANSFFWCGRVLKSIKTDCFIAAAACVNGQVLFALPRQLDETAREKAVSSLKSVDEHFRVINLTITAETIQELLAKLSAPQSAHNFQWLIDQIETIESLARKELRGKCFMYIRPELTRFWPTVKAPNIFGELVANNFPSATFDIHNAGISMATTLCTAAVFHLMRILEVGLTVMGQQFGVSLAHTNWAPAIEQIESKIRDMNKDPIWKAQPDCKEQQEFYAQAASHFAILKDAWRNHTMHARGKYTEDEAERIFENVKGFMQKLAERLHE